MTLEDGALYTGYSSFVKVDEAEYVPKNLEAGGSEDMLNGSYTDEDGLITITFDGEGTFGYSNNIIGEAGSGTYTYDGETLIVTIFQDGEEVSHAGLVGEEDYAVDISPFGTMRMSITPIKRYVFKEVFYKQRRIFYEDESNETVFPAHGSVGHDVSTRRLR